MVTPILFPFRSSQSFSWNCFQFEIQAQIDPGPVFTTL
jgi:hypothetical protein